VALTAVGAPAQPIEPEDADEPARSGGSWRSPWSPLAQADWASAYLSVALAKPFVQSVCWQELVDPPAPAEMPGGGLAGPAGTARPVLERLADLRAGVAKGVMPQHATGFVAARARPAPQATA
jgi:hypothetical protein